MKQYVFPLSGSDADNVEAKRRWVREHYEPGSEHKYDSVEGKLKLIAAIIANNWIEPQETLKLQCLGIAFGDALAQAMGLKWAAVEDESGRDPALVLEGTSIKVFPMTSTSKRIEAGETVDIGELFRSACNTIYRVRSEG